MMQRGRDGRVRAKLGIALTTYNRRQSLLDLVGRLERFTSVDYDLVIGDDGSTDGTADMLAETRIPAVFGRNKGIAWNKNRGLYHLMNFSAADILILMDDDVLPQTYGWEQEWIAAAHAFGHINYVPAHLRGHVLTGACRAADPGITHVVGGQCLGFTRATLQHVGYFDPRFGRYGHEHSDVTFRCLRAGFGGVTRSAGTASYFYVIDSGLALRDVPSNSDMESLDRNARLLMGGRRRPDLPAALAHRRRDGGVPGRVPAGLARALPRAGAGAELRRQPLSAPQPGRGGDRAGPVRALHRLREAGGAGARLRRRWGPAPRISAPQIGAPQIGAPRIGAPRIRLPPDPRAPYPLAH